MNENYEKWDELAPRGLLLTGFGLALLGQAISAKMQKKGFVRWFILGTLSMIAFNSGLSLFGEAVKYRTLYELDVKKFQQSE
ncbi:MAG: hypothetical protein RLP44_31035 [Aggregatilineales bacterium]